MATTRFVLTPESAHFPSSDYPALSSINARPVLLYDDTTDEVAYWTTIAPQGLSGALSLLVHCFCVDATSGTAAWTGAVEAITPLDAINLNSAASFAADNTAGTATVPGSAGNPFTVTVTLSTDDSIAAGDLVRFSVTRDVSGDSVSNDLAFTAAEIREA